MFIIFLEEHSNNSLYYTCMFSKQFKLYFCRNLYQHYVEEIVILPGMKMKSKESVNGELEDHVRIHYSKLFVSLNGFYIAIADLMK